MRVKTDFYCQTILQRLISEDLVLRNSKTLSVHKLLSKSLNRTESLTYLLLLLGCGQLRWQVSDAIPHLRFLLRLFA